MRRRATHADIRALPEHLVGELIDGELHVSARPASPHARASSVLGVQLGGPFDLGGGPGGWWILDEPELHFGGDVVVPDLAAWRRERLPRLPSTPAFELPPDWVCEVVSPSTGRLDRGKKMDVYARAGVAYAWLVDPLERLLEVYRLQGGPGGQWVRLAAYAGEGGVRAEPFEAVELAMGAWWLEGEG